jgi:transcriptional regulator with XRE-family HTH domain
MNKTEKPNERLKQQRELKGWSQAKLAEEVGTTQKIVSRWESGVSKPQPYYREKLIELFGMNAKELGLLDNDILPDEDDREANPPLEILNEQDAGSTSSSNNQRIQIVISTDIPAVTLHIHQQALIHASAHSVSNDMITEETQISPMLGRDDSEREMNRKRREFFKFLGIASSILLLPFAELDWERIEDALVKPSFLDTAVIQDFEAINTRCWNLYLTASSKSLVLDGVLGQFKMLVQFLQEPHSSQIHQQLCALSSDLSQLAGEIFFDRHEYDTAKSCYVFAANVAKEARAHDLWSCALLRHSLTAIYDEPARYQEALPFIHGAWKLALRGDSSLPTRYWAAAVEAETEAGVGNLVACQNALERANGVLEITHISPAWTRFDSSRLPALRGTCYLHLEQPSLAVPALEEGLNQFKKPGRKRGMVLTDLAMAALQGREVEQACAYMDQVIDIIVLGSSGFLRGSVEKVRRQLEPIARSESVHKLDQRIRSLA